MCRHDINNRAWRITINELLHSSFARTKLQSTQETRSRASQAFSRPLLKPTSTPINPKTHPQTPGPSSPLTVLPLIGRQPGACVGKCLVLVAPYRTQGLLRCRGLKSELHEQQLSTFSRFEGFSVFVDALPCLSGVSVGRNLGFLCHPLVQPVRFRTQSFSWGIKTRKS